MYRLEAMHHLFKQNDYLLCYGTAILLGFPFYPLTHLMW